VLYSRLYIIPQVPLWWWKGSSVHILTGLWYSWSASHSLWLLQIQSQLNRYATSWMWKERDNVLIVFMIKVKNTLQWSFVILLSTIHIHTHLCQQNISTSHKKSKKQMCWFYEEPLKSN
jgi:hypothetical protein